MPPRYKPSRSAALWSSFKTKINPERIFSSKRSLPQPRSIYVNTPLPAEAFDKKGKVPKQDLYATNQSITSKYTVITFVPRNLFEQFRRIANIFFLGIAILQFFPKFSTISPGLVILPLLAVLAITGGKDGYEDIKRHQSDKKVNHSVSHILSGGGYENHNQMAPKAKTFVKGVKLPQSKAKREAKRKEEAGWGQIVRDENTVDPDLEEGGVVRLPGEDLHGARTRESEVAAGQMPSTAAQDPEAGENEAANELGWRKTMWEDVKVGDFIKIYNNEGFPADVVICSTSEEEDVAYIETKNLDGETNLKSRHAVPELAHLRSALSCSTARFKIDCEPAEVNMFRLNAAVVVEGEGQDGGRGEQVRHPVNLETCLLRGCVLRNTAWVIGVVIFTGADSKIVMNSGGTPSKRSKVERQMNPQVLFSLGLLAVAGAVCAIVNYFNEVTWYRQNSYWTLYDDRSDDNPQFNGMVTFFNSLITFQNIVPISLYISIEFVRTAQALFIYWDDLIWHKKTDTRTMARSWNLSDDLGQIEYIFSDKTGTLTQNAMVFQQCSIAGVVYKGDGKIPDNVIIDDPATNGNGDAKVSRDETAVDPEQSPSSSERPLKKITTAPTDEIKDESTDGSGSDVKAKVKLPKEVLAPFHDDHLSGDLANQDTEQSTNIHAFFATLALCHTALASEDANGVIEYMAQSPDESALVQAAADVGFVFRGKDRNILRLQTPFSTDIDEYELLNVLEFSSARKRMSVLLRKMDDDGKIFLLVKGADNVIFERLAPGKEEMKQKTNKDLELFANEGLRTLCLGYRIVEDAEYEEWSRDFHDATVSLDNREELMGAVSAKIEHSLILLGATAIEDKLQDGVPAAIADLKRAGIKVWVATGDKLETAIAIGYSTNLLSRDSNLIIVRGGAYGTPNSAYDQMKSAIEQFFGPEIVEDVNFHPPELERTESRPSMSRRRSKQLRRTNSGVSSLVGDGNGDRPGGFSLVIEGSALTHAFEEEWTEDLLLQLSTRCNTVICCRVSPLQKAQVVHLIKDNLRVMTLAIGDGANDVSMIQAADVGIGISGEEGLQAVNSSDYAIAQFRYLTRLLFVHGHWSYIRNSNMILNFFYKNIIGVGVLFFFQIYCAWSTTYVFEYVYLLLWNVVWSLAPVIAMGVFDRDLDHDILMELPELYRYGRAGVYFGMGKYFEYIFEGVMQSAVIFFFINQAYMTTSARSDGYDVFMYEFSTTMVIGAILVCNAFHGISIHAWTGWVWFAVLVGPVLGLLFTLVYGALPPNTLITNVFGAYDFLFTSATFWFCIIFVTIVSLLPRYLLMAYHSIYVPSDIDVMKVVRKSDPSIDVRNHPALGGHFHKNIDDSGAELPPNEARPSSHHPRTSVQNDRFDEGDEEGDQPRQSMTSMRRLGRTHTGLGSEIDMSTGSRTPAGARSGFDFSAEEGGGVAGLRREQSRISHHSRATTRAQQLRQEGNQSTGRKRSGTLNSLRSRAGSVFSSGNKKKREQEAAMVPPLPTTRAESPPVPVDQ